MRSLFYERQNGSILKAPLANGIRAFHNIHNVPWVENYFTEEKNLRLFVSLPHRTKNYSHRRLSLRIL